MFRQKDRQKCEKLFDKYYAGRKFSRGQYKELIEQHVVSGGRLLDAGCGRDLEFSREFASDVQVIGVDLEEKLDTRNQRSPFALRGDLEKLPFPPNYFDLIISRSVVEHLQNPLAVFREFQRVLKPGGRIVLSTPNKFDYVSIVAALTPYRWHRVMVSKMTMVQEDDVFPTLYRANSLSSLGRQMREAGLTKRVLKAINHYPSYLMFSPVLFRIGMLYEKLTSFACFENLRGTILCVFEKEARPADASAMRRGRERSSEEVGTAHSGA